MEYIQNYNPLNNMFLSALVAAIPIILFFLCLVVFKLKGYLAATYTVLSSIIIALVVYKMPFEMVLGSFAYGFLYGLWPIAWIILAAIFLYKLSVKSGYFELIKQSVISITPDHRIQVILIAFCFGSFLEGAIGFGGPVAISAALLVGLGLRPLNAAGLCMIANTAPVAFGAVGIPIIAMAAAVHVPADAIGAMVGRMLPPVTLFVPFLIVFLMDGFKGIKETFPAILVAAGSFAITQFITANHIGPELPDITSAIVSIFATSLFLKKWQPKNIFRADGKTDFQTGEKLTKKQVILAWLPFLLLIVVIILWTIPFVKNILGTFTLSFSFPFIDGKIIETTPIVEANRAIKVVYSLEILKAVGTAILIAAIGSIFFLKIKLKVVKDAACETVKEMKIAILTIGLVLAFAFIAKNSAQAATLGLAMAETGSLASFFSPIIGWVGVFLTGSDTSANLLFGPLQQVTANSLGIPEVIFLAANTVGGVVGKMISPQSIAIACAAVGLVGKESELFRWTVKYSIIFVIAVGAWTFVITNFLNFIVPIY